jgi:hypothetical protein
MSYRRAAPAHTVGDRGVENSDSASNGEQSLPALEEDNRKEPHDKDDKDHNSEDCEICL